MGFDKIGILGAGAWGTALAQSCGQAGREVIIWCHEAETAQAINETHENSAFLPTVSLAPELKATTQLEALGACDAVLCVAPTQFLRPIIRNLAPLLKADCPLVICAKGIELKTNKLLSTVIEEERPGGPIAVLSGPSFASEVARNLPAAVTLAANDEALGQRLALSLGHTTFRPYWSDDVIGAQIGGAIKNVLAIGAGIVAGRAFGASAHAAFVARGFLEMTRFGEALGAKAETLSGLSGLGDLVLTCSSPQSRNMSLGHALGEGQSLEQILEARKAVTEGIYTAKAVAEIAHDTQLDLPLCLAVEKIVSQSCTVDEAIEDLLARPLRAERA